MESKKYSKETINETNKTGFLQNHPLARSLSRPKFLSINKIFKWDNQVRRLRQ